MFLFEVLGLHSLDPSCPNPYKGRYSHTEEDWHRKISNSLFRMKTKLELDVCDSGGAAQVHTVCRTKVKNSKEMLLFYVLRGS